MSMICIWVSLHPPSPIDNYCAHCLNFSYENRTNFQLRPIFLKIPYEIVIKASKKYNQNCPRSSKIPRDSSILNFFNIYSIFYFIHTVLVRITTNDRVANYLYLNPYTNYSVNLILIRPWKPETNPRPK